LRIIAINRFYRPDHSATSQLLGDLAEQLHMLQRARELVQRSLSLRARKSALQPALSGVGLTGRSRKVGEVTDG